MSSFLNENQFGCIPSTKDLRDYKLPKVAMALQLPEAFVVKHSPIKNQGGVCSCVAHSVAEVVEAINNNEKKFSTNWIYGYRPSSYSQGKGMMTRNALSTTVDLGCVLYDDFAGNDEVPSVKNTTMKNLAMLKEKAKEHKMYSYARLANKEEIKRAIYLTKMPIVLCVHCCDPFALDKHFVLKKSNKYSGYHCMVCYGWNELGLLIQNSWGENWGDKGTCILPDDYDLTEAWVLTSKEGDFAAVKPNLYAFRKIVQKIIDSIHLLFSRLKE